MRLQTYGCGDCRRASAAGELVASYTMDALAHLTAAVDEAFEGLPDDRRSAGAVVAGALRATARDYMRRRESYV